MRGPFFISLGLHAVVGIAMVLASGASSLTHKALPTSTVVRLVRPMGSQSQGGAQQSQKQGEPPANQPLQKFPKADKSHKVKAEEPVKTPVTREPIQRPTNTSGNGAGGKELKGEAGTLRVAGGGFEYDFYLAVVQSKVEQNFRPPPGLRSGSMATISFSIQKNGTLANINLAKSSGNLLIDQAAERAVRAAGRFPPLPAQYEQGQLDINFEFVVNASAAR
jgi:TonB family protein